MKANPPADLQLGEDHGLQALLVEHERWEDLGRIVKEPLSLVREAFARGAELDQIPEEHREQLRVYVRQAARQEAMHIHQALLAAGRKAEAEQVHSEALKLDGSSAAPGRWPEGWDAIAE